MINLEILLKNGERKSLSMDDIVKIYGFKNAVTGTLVVRLNTNDAGSLVATVNDRNKDDYPGIDVDGELNGKLYYAANVELPNPTSDVIISRLYCGNLDSESDDWAVMMPLGDRDETDESRRVVYVDGNLASVEDCHSGQTKNWPCEKMYKATTEMSITKLVETNTLISYMYRDASNYKNDGEFVVEGEITEDQIDEILDCCDCGEYFIPEQVGMSSCKFRILLRLILGTLVPRYRRFL